MKIETYVRAGEFFQNIELAEGQIKDSDYVEGYLVVRTAQVTLLGPRQWDYIDQLWSYLVEAACTAKDGRKGEFLFPDQPIQVSITPVPPRNLIFRVESSSTGDGNFIVGVQVFMKELRRAGTVFFERMIELNPSGTASYRYELDRRAGLQA